MLPTKQILTDKMARRFFLLFYPSIRYWRMELPGKNIHHFYPPGMYSQIELPAENVF
jgi:hypothetical protein